MNCRRVEQLLVDHLEGLVSQRQARTVAAHLQDCHACRWLAGEYLAMRSELRELGARLPLPDSPIERRSVARWIIERRASVRSGRHARQSVPARAASLASAVTLVVAALALYGWDPHGVGRPARAKGRPQTVGVAHVWPLALQPPRDLLRGRFTQEKPRLSGARVHDARHFASRLRAADPIGDDLAPVSRDPHAAVEQWVTMPQEDWSRIEARVRRAVRARDARGPAPGAVRFAAKARLPCVRIPFPRLASASDRQMAAAVESYRREAAIVDPRLAREVTLQQKAIALSDLCEELRADTGIQLGAGPSVADEKVTLFCKKMPLREVMRQLSRPFGYAWLRSGKAGEYRYELAQDLRSQLLEEELRNRDRDEALLALDREIERYRPYLSLSPDEALARRKTAPPAARPLLEKIAGLGWGPVQMYFRLAPQQLAALRAGEELKFSQQPKPGEQPLPPDVAQGVLQSMRDWRLSRSESGLALLLDPKEAPDGLLPAAVPEARALVTVKLEQSELGQFTLGGFSGITTFPRSEFLFFGHNGPYAVGTGPDALKSDKKAVSARLARDPLLRPRVTVQSQPFCRPAPDARPTDRPAPEPKVRTADVLEALHQATGLPIISDYFTRLYQPGPVSIRNQSLFDALNQLAGAMRMRWDKDGGWLEFRSTTFYHDRLKEVPNRLLARWATSRRQHGALTLDALLEIAQLPDAQLDAAEMAEGARNCFGLAEWDLARNGTLRHHLRYLTQFTPAQRQEAMSDRGLPFTRMSLSQQQGFIAHLRPPELFQSVEELSGATLRVDYTVPGWFMWEPPDPLWLRWVVPVEPGPQGRRVLMPAVRERTRAAALQAARQRIPQVTEAALQGARRQAPQFDVAQMVPREEQIIPTRLDLWIIYIPSSMNKHPVIVEGVNSDFGDPTL